MGKVTLICPICKEDHEREDHRLYWITIEEYLLQKQDLRKSELQKRVRHE